ncbi:MAG: hypothetical protein H6945_00945 [Zoogloeaceae bacterium]|nr:hypothetical protein [Rhodocyclaceae bacterium]MCP5234291.1 hypothetical protein [Zoogloeaceae bacterium]
MNLHIDLARVVGATFAGHLATEPDLRQDALLLQLRDGTSIEIRYAAADAYSLGWRRKGLWRRIDTAPCHPELATWPNHFHIGDGDVRADPVTRCGAEPWHNLRVLVQALVEQSVVLQA